MTLSTTIILTCQLSVIASALVAGVLLTFSDFVMMSLRGANTAAGIEVMQIINRKVYKSVFIVLLVGMSLLSPLFGLYAYFYLSGTAATLIVLGGAAYFIGVFIITLVFNVPMNNRLDGMTFNSDEAAQYWLTTYVPRWRFWNYLRAITATIAACCYLLACMAL